MRGLWSDSLLIYKNQLQGLDAKDAAGCGGGHSHERTAIQFSPAPLITHGVLYGNHVLGARRATVVSDAEALKVCRAGSAAELRVRDAMKHRQ